MHKPRICFLRSSIRLYSDENDYFREIEHNILYDWETNTKLICNYLSDQEVTWTFDTKSDEKYYQISSSGVLKYKALPEFFVASASNLDAISAITLNAINELGLITQISLGISPDNFSSIKSAYS